MLKTIIPVVALTLSASPAVAHTNVCAGTSSFVTAAPLNYLTATTTSFSLSFPTTQCVDGPSPETFSGTIFGTCGSALGSGITASGHGFGVSWTGVTLTFAGRVDGELHIVENVGTTCVNGARQFTVTGALVLHHT